MDALEQINRKILLMLMAGVLLLTIAASSAYGIWPQIKDINSGLKTKDELNELLSNKGQLDERHKSLIKEIEKIKHSLKGEMADLPEKKMESFIIGELQNISWEHKISLVSVKPANGNEIKMFQEILFDVHLIGQYFDLYSWLKDLRKKLGFVVIKNLELNSINQSTNNSIQMKLTVASYKSK